MVATAWSPAGAEMPARSGKLATGWTPAMAGTQATAYLNNVREKN